METAAEESKSKCIWMPYKYRFLMFQKGSFLNRNKEFIVKVTNKSNHNFHDSIRLSGKENFLSTFTATMKCLLFVSSVYCFSVLFYTYINSFHIHSTMLWRFFAISLITISLSAIVIRIMYNFFRITLHSIPKDLPPSIVLLVLKCLVWYLHLQSLGHVFVQFNIYISTDLSNNSAYNFWGISSIHMKKKKKLPSQMIIALFFRYVSYSFILSLITICKEITENFLNRFATYHENVCLCVCPLSTWIVVVVFFLSLRSSLSNMEDIQKWKFFFAFAPLFVLRKTRYSLHFIFI